VDDTIDYGAYLVRQLAAQADEAERNGHDAAVLRFLISHGRLYDRLATAQAARMTPNACFENAAAFLSSTTRRTYVEGFALVAVPRPTPFEHAWCVDAEARIYELTWDRPGLAYFGVAFATGYVARRVASARHPEHGLLRGNGCDALLDGDEKDWRA
jgi:hypothetical protein